METKNPESVVLKATQDLSYVQSAFVPPHGHGGGGLALFWKQEMDVEIISACDNYFDTKVTTQWVWFFALLCMETQSRARGSWFGKFSRS